MLRGRRGRICLVSANGASVVPAHSLRRPTAGERGGARPGGSGGRGQVVVEGRYRPATGPVLIGEGEARAWRLDLEERARSRHDGVGGSFLANGSEPRDRETLVSPCDLSGASVAPSGPNVDLARFYSDHCQLWLLPAGASGFVHRPGAHPRLERLFCYGVILIEQAFDVKGLTGSSERFVTPSLSRLVGSFDGIEIELVSIVAAGSVGLPHRLGLTGRRAWRSSVDRGHRIVLERRR